MTTSNDSINADNQRPDWMREQIAKWINDGQDSEKVEAYNLKLKEQEKNQVVMEIKTKYVITDTTKLISPIGYSLDKPVYLQTKIAIQIDNLAKFKVPSGTTLYAHDVEKITAKYFDENPDNF